MAITDVSATHKNAVRAFLKRLQDLMRPYGRGTKGADGSKIGRVLKATDTGQVRPGVRAPVAEKADYGGFKSLVRHD
jgi:hypothetical protein